MRRTLSAAAAVSSAVALVGGASASPDGSSGRIVFVREGRAHVKRLAIVRADGKGLRRVLPRRISAQDPAWRPDGKLVAYAAGRIFVARPDGSGVRRVTNAAYLDRQPTWSPDGRRLAFVHMGRYELDTGKTALYSVTANGSDLRRLTEDAFYDQTPTWSPDGKAIAFSRGPPAEFVVDPSKQVLSLVDADGSNVRALGSTAILGTSPAWAPDGKRLAFVSYRDHFGSDCGDPNLCPRWHGELYLVNSDGTGLRRLTRTRLDEQNPAWSNDGKTLVFSRGWPGGTRRRYQLYTMRIGGRPKLLAPIPGLATEPNWSR